MQRMKSRRLLHLSFTRTDKNSTVLSGIHLTLKKSKKETCLTSGPYRLSSCLKKKKLVKAASTTSGWARESLTSSSRSCRLSRPLQNAVAFFSGHGGPVLACTDIMSRLTLFRQEKTHQTSSHLVFSAHVRGKNPVRPGETRWRTFPWSRAQTRSGRRWAWQCLWCCWSHTRRRWDGGCCLWASSFPGASRPGSQRTPHQGAAPAQRRAEGGECTRQWTSRGKILKKECRWLVVACPFYNSEWRVDSGTRGALWRKNNFFNLTFLVRDSRMESINILNPTCSPKVLT